ncbi:MAG: peptidase glycoprotease [Rhodospirillales bacterium]|nr:peptidase glycoprotease [Rhodospirillales bacterium]
MIALALDSSGSACSVALVEGGGTVLAHRFRAMARGHAELLLPMLRDAMAEAEVGFDSLGLIAVTVGPGSFTGIRVGLSAARGLALATGLPAVGITAFEAVAAAVEPAGQAIVVAIDSRRSELFVQVFAAGGSAAGPPIAVAPADLAASVPSGELVLAGDGAGRAAAALTTAGRAVRLSGIASPDARDVARVALRQRIGGGALSPLRPLYLRAPDVTLPPAPGGVSP